VTGPADGDGASHRGIGSDVSQFCAITDTQNRLKRTIAGWALVPGISLDSLTDPLPLTTMPMDLAVHSALDALTSRVTLAASARTR
jgi:1,3-propanediol dehydrogenase